jgi:hypothetical protein
MAEDRIQQLFDIEEIKQLKARYCLAVAREDWATFESLFAEELEFLTPDGEVHAPRSEFMKFHKANLQEPKLWGFLRCTSPIIDITGLDTATGVWQMEDVHIWPGEGPRVGHHGYGHYHEDYVRLAEGWRFRRIEVIYTRMEPLEGGFGPGAGP